jgi:hypothetical protein
MKQYDAGIGRRNIGVLHWRSLSAAHKVRREGVGLAPLLASPAGGTNGPHFDFPSTGCFDYQTRNDIS